jgi:NDP-sugar pyrophosphorylase family protein
MVILKNNMKLIILSGGFSTRTGFLYKISPKFLVPIWNTNLLFRQIDQALENKIYNIFVSTRPELYKLIKELCFDRYHKKVVVIKNPMHKKGILNALLYSIKIIGTENVVISLSDIFYSKNPFTRIVKEINLHGFIFAGHSFKKVNKYTGGGILTFYKKRLIRLDEDPKYTTLRGAYWNGLVYQKNFNISTLKIFLKKYKKTHPIGDYFNTLINHRTFFIETGIFVNCNTLEHLHKSSQLAFLESKK